MAVFTNIKYPNWNIEPEYEIHGFPKGITSLIIEMTRSTHILISQIQRQEE